jgi:hypothetical protein
VTPLSRIRQWMLALLLFGLTGTIVELLLLEHYEEGWQLVPLFLIGLALGVLVWHLVRPRAGSVRALQVVMCLFLLAGAVGVGLHFDGAAEFQVEIDPSQSRWEVFKKAMRAKAPPVLAPGVMMQLGLLGLMYAYRHPALSGSGTASRERE